MSIVHPSLKVVQVERQSLDLDRYKLRSATERDYTRLIDEPCLIAEGDAIKIVYLELELDSSDLVAALQRISYHKEERTDGLVTTSAVFGYLPRIAIRRDFCTATKLAMEQPEEHATVCAYAAQVNAYYQSLNPAVYGKHEQTTDASIISDYRIKDSVFTSGIINKNNPLKYHFDAGNFKDVWSCMLVFKRDVEGGYLSVPEYDIAFKLRNNSLLMFDGQQLLHGVTPIIKTSPAAYRYSIVYYSLQQMWRCEPPGAELARIRKIKTQRERKRADAMRSLSVDMHAPVRYPIYVPSKGRASSASVPGILRACGLPYTLVVEPHEAERYAQDYPEATYLILPERDRGITDARQSILDHARSHGYARYWQIDDNIEKFLYVENGVQQAVTANVVLHGIEALVGDRPDIALAAADYAQFAALAAEDVTANTRTYCCVLTRTDTGINYRPETEMKEDVDFCVQHLAAGYQTLLAHRYAMAKPKMGASSRGGLVPKYRAGLQNDAARAVHALWPEQTKLIAKKDGIDVQVDWSAFRRAEAESLPVTRAEQ